GALHAGPGAGPPGNGFRGLLRDHERPGRAQALQPRQARLLRVRHRADPAARRRRSGPGEVLHHRDALHRVRHRDHLPLPLGRPLRCDAVVRADRDGALHRHGLRGLCVRLASRRTGLGL
ncbi:MAG: NADH ubiquinone oxidoreductase chain A, partial [uncultured Nocardioides sp.]